MTKPLECAADLALIRVWRFAGQDGLHQRLARRVCKLVWERTGQWLDIAVERKAEVLHRAHYHQAFAPALALEYRLRPSAAGVTTNGALGNLRAFDARARHAKPIGEVPQRSRDRAPAAAYRAAADTRFPAVGGLFVDD